MQIDWKRAVLAGLAETVIFEHMPWAQPLLAEELRLVDGRVQLPDRPGLSLVWDTDAVKRWTVS